MMIRSAFLIHNQKIGRVLQFTVDTSLDASKQAIVQTYVGTYCDWGDGTSETSSSDAGISHTYPSSGIYTTTMAFPDVLAIEEKYIHVNSRIVPTINIVPSCQDLVLSCRNLTLIDIRDIPNTVRWLSLQSCSTFNQDIGGWNVSHVTSLLNCFNSCNAFNQDISGWNTHNVTNMTQMFQYATVFDQDLSGWCVEKIPSKPSGFDTSAGFQGQTSKQPKWGTPC